MTVECGSLSRMAKKTSRRNFLRTASVAAAAGLSLTDKLAFAAQASPASGADVAAALRRSSYSPRRTGCDAKALQAQPGDNTLLHQPRNSLRDCDDDRSPQERGGVRVARGARPHHPDHRRLDLVRGRRRADRSAFHRAGEWHATGSTAASRSSWARATCW